MHIAPCGQRGKPRGASIDATARLLPAGEVPALVDGLIKKYGLLGRLTTTAGEPTGRESAVIGITVP